MRCESRSPDSFGGRAHSRYQTDAFQMEMPACNFCVVGNFGKDVWKQIGRTYLGSIVKLGANCRGKGRLKSNKSADILVGVLNAHPSSPVIVEVVGNSDLRGTGVGQAYPDVLILVISDRQFGGVRTNSDAVGGQPTPGLSAENFPLTALETHKAKAHTQGVAVHGLICIGRVIAAEVRFAVGGHIRVANFVCDPYVEAGKLCGETILGKVALGRVAIWDRRVVGGDIVLGVGGAIYILNVHKATQPDICRTNSEGRSRFLCLSLAEGH